MPLTVWELLHAGDWACAHGDGEALADVATALASCFSSDGSIHSLASRIADLAPRSLLAATGLWSDLTESLREGIAHPGP